MNNKGKIITFAIIVLISIGGLLVKGIYQMKFMYLMKKKTHQKIQRIL